MLKTRFDNIGKTRNGWPDFEDVQRLICPHQVEGYALNQKMWAYLDVSLEYLHEIDDPDVSRSNSALPPTAFDRIVLPKTEEWKTTREVIKTLVKAHGKAIKEKISVPEPFEDLIEGKGQGLVILLWGTHWKQEVASLY